MGRNPFAPPTPSFFAMGITFEVFQSDGKVEVMKIVLTKCVKCGDMNGKTALKNFNLYELLIFLDIYSLKKRRYQV